MSAKLSPKVKALINAAGLLAVFGLLTGWLGLSSLWVVAGAASSFALSASP